MDNINEIWIDIKGFDGAYQVSNLGRIKSIPRKRTNSGAILKGKIFEGLPDGERSL